MNRRKNHDSFRKVCVLLILAILVLSFGSCSEDDGSDYIFKTVISENPKNLDPILAEDKSSLMIIQNNFEGLVCKNSRGEISNGCAKDYEISSDELIYTFYLKEDIFWHTLDNENKIYHLTADDFLFTFERIFDIQNPISPYRDDFSNIFNAEKVLSGELPLEELGVYVVDDYTIKFRLEEKSYSFLNLLASSSAMPCNREFFKSTKGRYGLFAETTASNGPFYVKEWNFDPYWDENFIIMRRNNEYLTSRVFPLGLNFFIKSDEQFSNFLDGDYHCIDDKNPQEFKNNDVSVQGFCTSVYGALFNAKSEIFSNSSIKKAFAYSLNRELIAFENSKNFTKASGIIPKDCYILGKKYRESINENQFSFYDPIKASNLFYDEIDNFGIDGKIICKILMIDGEFSTEMLEPFVAQWEKNLGISCKIEAVSEKEFQSKLSEGDFDILLSEISSNENSPENFIASLTETADLNNLSFDFTGIYSKIAELEKTPTVSDAIEKTSKIERDILNSGEFIPICYSYDYFYIDNSTANIEYFPFSDVINFKDAVVIG